MTKFELYRAERNKGLTYREIAKKYGVSYQCVAQACAKSNPRAFQFHKETEIIYPNLRKWMNDNKISTSELVRRLGFCSYSNSVNMFRSYLKGKNHFRKPTIDKLIEVTGLPYEELFKESEP